VLTCIVCKIFETIIKDTMLLYLNHYCLITKDQHGFLKRHSTVTNLLECVNDWTTSLNNRSCVDILFLILREPLMLCLTFTKNQEFWY